MALELYDYQTGILELLRQGFAQGHKHQILVAPTGAGKTEMAIALLEASSNKGNRAAMILDRIVLCDQTSQRLQKYNIAHGVMQSGHWRNRPYERIQICSAQTIEKRGSFPGLKLMIVDEAHQTRKQTMEFIKNNPDVFVVGLTATPFTKGLKKTYSRVVSSVTTQELVKIGKLAPLRVYVAKEIDMTGAKKVAGEWAQDEVTERGLKITGDIVTEWVKKTHEVFGGPRKTIVFCSGVAHGADLAEKFAAAGYNFVSLSYKDDDQFKQDAVAEFSKADTTIHGLIATDILTKGFDVSDVMIGVSARPFSKSLSSHIQQMGRVMRSHPGKDFALWLDHCIAGDQRVLTHRGLVRIDAILLTDKIWDGHDFVTHKGVISRGKRPVISYAGITATPDHLVKTADEGWCSLGYCADKQKGVITTGIGRKEVRERDGYLTGRSVVGTKTSSIHACSLRVRYLRLSFSGFIDKFGKWENKGMQAMQPAEACAGMAERQSCGNARPVQEREKCDVPQLWWKGNQVQVRFSDFLRSLDSRELGIIGRLQGDGTGSHRQQRKLRTGEHTVFAKTGESQQHEKNEVRPSDAQIHDGKPGYSIRGMYAAAVAFCGSFIRGNSDPVSQKEQQAEREVWDILDCGPRNSFTCEGLLVHNSGNYLRFRDDWDDVYENGVNELDDGKEKAKKEPTEIEKKDAKCPKCSHLWPSNSDTCPGCGHVRERRNTVSAVPGQMEELGAGSGLLKQQKQSWYSQLLFLCEAGQYNPGWAAHKYKEKFGSWPNGLDKTAIAPTSEVSKWVVASRIRWAKSKRKEQAVAA